LKTDKVKLNRHRLITSLEEDDLEDMGSETHPTVINIGTNSKNLDHTHNSKTLEVAL